MKKFILIVFGLFVLVVGFQAFNLFVLNPPKPEKPKVVKKVDVKPWKGNGRDVINASFDLNKARFAIIQTGFTGLNKNRANLAVTIQAAAVNGKVPRWMKNSRSFRGRILSRSYFPARIKTSVKGSRAIGTIWFLDIPTASLGKTCKQKERSESSFRIEFVYPSPRKRIFSMVVSAPKPPKDHCLAEAGAKNIKPKVNIYRIKLQTQPNSSLVRIYGFANVPGNKVYVWVNNKRVSKANVNSAKRFIAKFRIAKPKGSVLVRVGTKDQPGLARKKTALVK